MKIVFHLSGFLFYVFISGFIFGMNTDALLQESMPLSYKEAKMKSYISNLNDIIFSLKQDSVEENNISMNQLDQAVIQMQEGYLQLHSSEAILFDNLLEIKKIIIPLLNSLKSIIMQDLLVYKSPYNQISFGKDDSKFVFIRIAFSEYVRHIYSKPIPELKKIISRDGISKIVKVLNHLILVLTDKFINKSICSLPL